MVQRGPGEGTGILRGPGVSRSPPSKRANEDRLWKCILRVRAGGLCPKGLQSWEVAGGRDQHFQVLEDCPRQRQTSEVTPAGRTGLVAKAL